MSVVVWIASGKVTEKGRKKHHVADSHQEKLAVLTQV